MSISHFPQREVNRPRTFTQFNLQALMYKLRLPFSISFFLPLLVFAQQHQTELIPDSQASSANSSTLQRSQPPEKGRVVLAPKTNIDTKQLDKSVALDFVNSEWANFDKDTPEKIAPPPPVQPGQRTQITLFSSEGTWRETVSPPYPNVWPPNEQRSVSYYAFAEYVHGHRDFNSVNFSAPWAKVVLQDNVPPVKLIYLTSIGKPISGWCNGGLCLPVSPDGLENRREIFQNETEKVHTLLSWTGLPDGHNQYVDDIRKYYCRWEYEHTKLVSDYIEKNHREFFNWLACKSSQESVRDKRDQFIDAIRSENEPLIRKMLADGYDPTDYAGIFDSPLFMAYNTGNIVIFDLLIENGAARKFDRHSWTPLFWGAVTKGNFKFANRLISLGVDSHEIDKSLMFAKTDEMRDFLFSFDSNPGDKLSTPGRVDALDQAVGVGDDIALQYLLQHVDYGAPELKRVLIMSLCPPQRYGYMNQNSDRSYFTIARLLISAATVSERLVVPCKVRSPDQEFASFLKQHPLVIFDYLRKK